MRALITGHSRGLGAALCEALLAGGAEVLALARRPHEELATRFPGRLSEVAIDLADSRGLAQWLDGPTLRSFLEGGETRLLINNAGCLQPIGAPGGQGSETIASSVALNVSAALMLTDAFVAATAASTDRRVLHVSSGAARTPYAGWSIYCAAKAALDHHARAVQQDPIEGLRIASVAPGVIDTDMQAEIRASSAEDFPLIERFAALKREGQLLSPADCAGKLSAYLLSHRFGAEPVTDLRSL